MSIHKPAQFQGSLQYASRSASQPGNRPLPFRTTSEPDAAQCITASYSAETRVRTKSGYTFSPTLDLSTRSSQRLTSRSQLKRATNEGTPSRADSKPLSPITEHPRWPSPHQREDSVHALQLSTPPQTPVTGNNTEASDTQSSVEIVHFDFSRVDYELERARRIGEGLWSVVYLAEPVKTILKRNPDGELTPPASPEQSDGANVRLFAVKTPARPDSIDVFVQEARVLSRLQQSAAAHEYIVSFHGLDRRNSSLVFEGVLGGSLDDLLSRLQVMTELARHLELRTLYPGLASDLIKGLRHIHAAGVVHADIKPANILLDITDEHGLQRPVLRARYIDFSSSFIPGEDTPKSIGGGTWHYMAPEQIRSQTTLPTFASDVWSLGVTLLSLISGGSPYKAACGSNFFKLREAISIGDPVGFALMDPVIQKRMVACQDLIDCCRLALQKDSSRRYTAAAWAAWLEK